MSENTKIEWCDHTYNHWIGCNAISPGCANCYAADWAKRYGRDFATRTRTKTSGDPVKWNNQHEAFFAQHGRRQRVFCSSLSDVFDNAVPAQWRYDLFNLILSTPNLDWLLLTKRIGNAAKMIEETLPDNMKALPPECPVAWPWPNVWIGATIVSQEEADRDIPKLLTVPAAKRFLSMEPLLGPVDLNPHLWVCCGCPEPGGGGDGFMQPPDPPSCCGNPEPSGIDWVIVGGESGPGARPMHPDWARDLRDQCEKAYVPFLFKQWGEWTPGENVERQRGVIPIASLWNDEWQISDLNLATDGGHIDDEPDLYRVGKKAAGRLLDGRTWDGFPS